MKSIGGYVGDLITLAEAAAISKCSADTIKRRVKRGEITATKVGRTVRIDRDTLGPEYASPDLCKLIGEAFAGVSDQLDRLTEMLKSEPETKAATS